MPFDAREGPPQRYASKLYAGTCLSVCSTLCTSHLTLQRTQECRHGSLLVTRATVLLKIFCPLAGSGTLTHSQTYSTIIAHVTGMLSVRTCSHSPSATQHSERCDLMCRRPVGLVQLQADSHGADISRQCSQSTSKSAHHQVVRVSVNVKQCRLGMKACSALSHLLGAVCSGLAASRANGQCARNI
jgi:hypothetical protein